MPEIGLNDNAQRPEKPRRAMPHEHKEIARGSGPAAILLFLHIAVTGYLLAVVLFLLLGNITAFWNLVPLRAGLVFYLPAAFAAMVCLPTDKLTMIVGRVAMITGIFTALVYGAGLITQWIHGETGIKPGVETAGAIVFGVMGGVVLRKIFGVLLRERRNDYEKNAMDEKSF